MAIAGVEGERVLDAPDRGAVVLEHVAVAERAQQPPLATMRPPPAQTHALARRFTAPSFY